MQIFDKIVELRSRKIAAVLCTVISSSGSTPRKAGSKMIVDETGKIFGTIGGGKLELTVTDVAMQLMNSTTPLIKKYDLTKDLGMTCGGSVEIFIESVSNKYKLFIFGAGHIGKSLAKIIRFLDFEIHVIDDRENIFDDWEKDATISLHNSSEEFIAKYPADKYTYIVIVTHSHPTDAEILKKFINKEFAYCGMIGSKRKAAEVRKMFIKENLTSEVEFNKIDLPIGLSIGAEGPDEIAVSIAAKLIEIKNKQSER